ncbi:MAG: 16S rRNA (adenine(1518)-N(6)/adenine(1519)-N(6))-dimethyltransferase RsmA [Bacteroidales bacterium]|nr:16S rRNA (adenine(1518)-N(6)/adenine(1519)-N(6))-dimethyltransferase RsmA [Bacteroidales bacterium]
MGEVRAKKSLGQHFLTDKNIALKIAQSLSVNDDVHVLEIGPGTGVLTDHLLAKYQYFNAIEIDTESVEFLTSKHKDAAEWLIEGDFLNYQMSTIAPNLAVIGNFPYYISSQIFFKVLESKDQVCEVVCMIQKEVADRLASSPGTKKYGLLSVLLQAYYDIEYLFTVHEHCFQPAPKVKSAVIRLKRNKRLSLDCDEQLFKKIVKATFNQRRKTIRKSLQSIFINLGENKYGQKRPEQLSVEEFEELTLFVEKEVI